MFHIYCHSSKIDIIVCFQNQFNIIKWGENYYLYFKKNKLSPFWLWIVLVFLLCIYIYSCNVWYYLWTFQNLETAGKWTSGNVREGLSWFLSSFRKTHFNCGQHHALIVYPIQSGFSWNQIHKNNINGLNRFYLCIWASTSLSI